VDKPKPKITQVKAPTKWDILKAKSKHIKQYLKGTIVKGTSVTGAAKIPTVSISKYDNGETLQKHQRRRKKLKKISYTSRRKNRKVKF
jgi:hypothetical protein